MKWSKFAIAGIMLASGFAASNAAFAWHGHHGPRVGLYLDVGPAFGWPWYYPAPVYRSYPPVVVETPAAPPVYIEQQAPVQAAPTAPAAGYWYYCRRPQGYYPYVKTCPDGWQQVSPQPPDVAPSSR